MSQKNHQDIKSITVRNLAWRFAERCGTQGVAAIVSIILARLVSPADYGTIALVTVFTTILQVFVDSGMGNALIQKNDADDLDFSTVFYFGIILCCVLYIGVFVIAPYIAQFFSDISLIPIIRILSLTLIISGIKNVQQAYVSKQLMFKKFFFATLGGTLGAAVIGIWMAYKGFGVWALVAQQLFNVTVDTIILWIIVDWRPKLMFSYSRLKKLFSFGWKILVSNLINTIYNDIRQLIIGKTYTSTDLAYYNRGKQFPQLIMTNINTSIDSVLLPLMAKNQENTQRIKSMTRRAIMTSSYLMWPLMFGLMAIGKPLVSILLTEKWLPSVPFLYQFCFVYGMQPIHTANLNAIMALGRGDLYLRMEIIKKIIGMALILMTMNISVYAIGFSSVIYTMCASIINAAPNKKLLNYSYLEQIKDIGPSFILAAVMAFITYCVSFIGWNDYITLFLQIILYASFYLIGSVLFKLESYQFVLDTIKKFRKH